MLPAILTENRKTLALAAPIIAGQLGQMLMGWADTLMVGRVGVTSLAACAFANTVLAVALVFGFGILTSVSVRTSQTFGAGRSTGKVYRAALTLGVLLGAVLCVVMLALLPVLPWFGQPHEVNIAVIPFLILTAISVIPVMVFTASKSFSEALSRPWPAFWIVLGGVALNVGLNFIFIFGNLGSPALGLTGAGLATLIARICTVIALLTYLHHSAFFRPYLAHGPGERSMGQELRDMLRVGLPAGGQYLAEVGAFATASLMMGWISVQALAAHQIAITCAATTFMIPLGLGMAVTVRIGQAVGARDLDRVRPIAFGGLGLALIVSACTAVGFILGARLIAGLFISDPMVIALATSLLVIAGFFQLVDAMQIVTMNALRGLADVSVPMGLAIISYWGVALPLSWTLAFRLGVGPAGIWVGLAIGLLFAAGLLTWRFFWKSSSVRLAANYRSAHA
ncbi:MAG TPA: MATE family efflux transporter [Chthoniobacterales bacterium]|nr:MATE family efflux transporter [Chthoniobacterales bacterium]